MKTKYITRYIIISVFVTAWLHVAYINRIIVIEPLQKFWSKEYTFEQTRDEIAKNYPDKLEEKYEFINLNGLYVRMTGGRKCNDIIKLKNGSLTTVIESYDIKSNAQQTIALKEKLAEKEIDYLYVQAPFKTNSELMPYGLVNEADNNANAFLAKIDGKVPYIDLRPFMTDSDEHINQYFYKTDHHWNPLGAFKAFQIISEYLQAQYPDETINGDYQNIDNWEIHRKENWFLGSSGKRTGIYFGGVDDLIWLTPKFETEMSCANIYRDDFYYGDYYKANIREYYITEQDYFMSSAYNVYIGGDFPLIQHRNASAPVEKKVLIIKDSFVLPLQTYFSTVFSEVDVIDLRHYTAGTLYEYIEESNPDIVITNINASAVPSYVVFEEGISEDNFNGNPITIYQNDEVTIEADDDEANKYVPIYEGVEAGKRYTFMCDSASVMKGNPLGVISIKLYDETTETFYDCSMLDVNYYEKKGSFKWTFTAPSDVSNLKILVYSGIAGRTNGDAIKLNNVRILQE